MIACNLLKWVHLGQDTLGRDLDLRYFRDNEQREVDFVITENNKPLVFIECKWSDHSISPHLKYLKNKFPKIPTYQISYQSKKDFSTAENIRFSDAHIVLNEIRQIIF